VTRARASQQNGHRVGDFPSEMRRKQVETNMARKYGRFTAASRQVFQIYPCVTADACAARCGNDPACQRFCCMPRERYSTRLRFVYRDGSAAIARGPGTQRYSLPLKVRAFLFTKTLRALASDSCARVPMLQPAGVCAGLTLDQRCLPIFVSICHV
jgi:hypothetical protein